MGTSLTRILLYITHNVQFQFLITYICLCMVSTPGHEYKLLSLSRVNTPGLLCNWFCRVGLVARRFTA